MLGCHDPQPASDSRRRKRDSRTDYRQHDKHDLAGPGNVPADQRQRFRHQHHQHKVAADQQQRERSESDRARRIELHTRPCGVHAERKQCRHDPGKQSAQIRKASRVLAAEIGDRIEVEIIGKNAGQRDSRPAQDQTQVACCSGIEIVKQHQCPDRHQHVDDEPHLKRRADDAGNLACPPQDQQHHGLQQLHQHQRNDHRADRFKAGGAAICGKQAEYRGDQRQIAGHCRNDRRTVIRPKPGGEGAPQGTTPGSRKQGTAIGPRTFTILPQPQHRARAQHRARQPRKRCRQRHDGAGHNHRAPSGHRITRMV